MDDRRSDGPSELGRECATSQDSRLALAGRIEDVRTALRAAADSDRPDKGIVRAMLVAMGADPDDPGLVETPRRVVDSWAEMLAGYQMDPAEVLETRFKADCSEMVTLSGIEFYSTCEHHLLPFSGRASVAYIPGQSGEVVGISKLARIVECFGRRLQLQERMSRQIADAIEENLNPLGVAVHITGKHLCMVCRGVAKPAASMKTTALRGLFKTDLAARSEFMNTIS